MGTVDHSPALNRPCLRAWTQLTYFLSFSLSSVFSLHFALSRSFYFAHCPKRQRQKFQTDPRASHVCEIFCPWIIGRKTWRNLTEFSRDIPKNVRRWKMKAIACYEWGGGEKSVNGFPTLEKNPFGVARQLFAGTVGAFDLRRSGTYQTTASIIINGNRTFVGEKGEEKAGGWSHLVDGPRRVSASLEMTWPQLSRIGGFFSVACCRRIGQVNREW